MTRRDEPGARPRGGLPDKRRAILAGAHTVFARDGYTRASVDAISAEAGVSTRTVYNHFQDKAELFETVIQESAARVSDAHIAIIDRHLSKVTDLEADLVEFGIALAGSWSHGFTEHSALVRQINADAGHLPAAALEAWQQAGPVRVRQELARRLARLADRGLLRVDDSQVAAIQFQRLTMIDRSSRPELANTDAELAEMVVSGVRLFLHGCAR
ncbi:MULTISPECIES: TetR/AcrR family transcriptional regulator [Actinoalloteichus]|uniref:Transcriptional regulator, TetR family n=1 Tax=Actinoalloteichus fjordicus TaxID=1612552 RepID=A0AAC9PSB0_9PSEU|nr:MULTISPECIES: TetR/AcrR family transcriptional regulator [Actinoalloteichus]APU14948.1 transcriptional regulator, TetR family [Actinoalloteichus fjordicus]APU21018.1 transcriptional regulator, TetR family [Actinoalloteichus sp. GBA129-24]